MLKQTGDTQPPTLAFFLAGEQLPFLSPVVTEGRPEEWLNRIEEGMFATTKKHLYKVLEESKGEAELVA